MCVCVGAQCTRATCCELQPCDPNISAQTLLVYGVKRRQKGSQVVEPQRLTKRGSGPKQHALAGLKKVRTGRGTSSTLRLRAHQKHG